MRNSQDACDSEVHSLRTGIEKRASQSRTGLIRLCPIWNPVASCYSGALVAVRLERQLLAETPGASVPGRTNGASIHVNAASATHGRGRYHGLHYDSAGLVFRVGSPAWRRVGSVLIVV
jgi:hypothetical protein